VQHAPALAQAAVQPLRRLAQIELDHFRRAGADQEQRADFRAAFEQLQGDAVELVIAIGHAGQIAFLDDGRGKARLCKDHHPGRRLQQMGAGARADHQEEGILHLAVQPDDAGQPAEHRALAALAQHGRNGRSGG
jgi:hypothetical protein